MCDAERYRLVQDLEDAVDQVTLYYEHSTKDPTNFALGYAVGSLTRRYGRLRAYEEEREQSKKDEQEVAGDARASSGRQDSKAS